MSQNKLVASIRSNKGKTANQKLRQSGNIPAVLYGPRGSILLEMVEETTRHLLEKMTGMHELVPITVTDSSKGESWTAQVVLREVQKHPYKHLLTHLDFWELPAAKEQIIRVPIEPVGEAPGVKSGGVLQMVVWDIPVSCLPANIPASIELDTSELDVGDSIRILDIKLPENVSHTAEENYAVITIVGRVKEEEESVEEEAEVEGEETGEDSAEEATEE